MAISDQIYKGISKGRDVLATADAFKGILPEPLSKALGTFINGSSIRPNAHRNINEFRSLLNTRGGVARTNMFDVMISIPKIMGGRSGLDSRSLSLLCDSAVLPGVSLNTSEIKRYGVGVAEKKPYSPTYTDQTFSFIGDNTGAVHGFFYKWMNGIVKSDLSGGNQITTGYNGLSAFEVEYKDDYAVDIVITCYDEQDNKIIVCTLRKAFPIFLGDIQLSWSENDQFMKVPVTFNFTHWDLEIIDINSLVNNPGASMSTLQQIMRVGTAIQTIASIRKPTGVADIVNVVNNAKIAIGGLGGIF